MNMIHAEKLVYEYDKRDEEGNVIGTNRAIDGVDIDVPQGSFVAVLGHNGSGKSTLAKHMNAILIPTGGTVWVDGQDTKDPENLWDVRKSAGMLDPNGRKEVLQAVARLRKEKNVTVILITHYMEEVIDADQVFVMDSGHIVMHGTPREIFGRADELKSYRMDVPQVTMLAEELRKRGLDIPKGILRREELVEALCRLR